MLQKIAISIHCSLFFTVFLAKCCSPRSLLKKTLHKDWEEISQRKSSRLVKQFQKTFFAIDMIWINIWLQFIKDQKRFIFSHPKTTVRLLWPQLRSFTIGQNRYRTWIFQFWWTTKESKSKNRIRHGKWSAKSWSEFHFKYYFCLLQDSFDDEEGSGGNWQWCLLTIVGNKTIVQRRRKDFIHYLKMNIARW